MVCSLALLLALQLDPGSLIPLYQQALAEAEKQYGPSDRHVAQSATDLGLFLRNQNQRQQAAVYLWKALGIEATPEHLENLASVLDPPDALPLYLKAGNWAKAGAMYAALGRKTEAADAYRKALAQEEKKSGPASPTVAVRLNDLAQLLDPKSAEPLLRRALAIETKVLGADNPSTATTMNNLASALLDLRRMGEAEPLARRALKTLESALGLQHPRVGVACSNLGAILREKPDLPGARAFYLRALTIDEAAYGPQHPEVAADLKNLAETLHAMGRKAEAASLMQRAAAIDAAR